MHVAVSVFTLPSISVYVILISPLYAPEMPEPEVVMLNSSPTWMVFDDGSAVQPGAKSVQSAVMSVMRCPAALSNVIVSSGGVPL